MQVILPGFSVRLFCFAPVWLYVFLGCTRGCVSRCDGYVICVDHALGSGMSTV